MSTASVGDVTALLLQWQDEKPEAREQLISLVYKELRSLASRALKSERCDHTLQPTALVHETYQKLIDQRRVRWQNRAHFFAVAATLMRRILVDHARRHAALQRAQDAERLLICNEVDQPESEVGTAGKKSQAGSLQAAAAAVAAQTCGMRASPLGAASAPMS